MSQAKKAKRFAALHVKGTPVANFIETQNIARFKTLLETEQHPDKRQILIGLLADEEAKHDARIGLPASDREGDL